MREGARHTARGPLDLGAAAPIGVVVAREVVFGTAYLDDLVRRLIYRLARSPKILLRVCSRRITGRKCGLRANSL
jgi:hypothetical protein